MNKRVNTFVYADTQFNIALGYCQRPRKYLRIWTWECGNIAKIKSDGERNMGSQTHCKKQKKQKKFGQII